MSFAKWGSVTTSARIAAIAFGLHALLVLMDWLFFAAAYSGLGHGKTTFWAILRILAFCAFAGALIRGERFPGSLGFIVFAGFLFNDLMNLIDGDLLRSGTTTSAQVLLIILLLLSQVVGIAALWWSATRTIFRSWAA